jgi:hypothetical protein
MAFCVKKIKLTTIQKELGMKYFNNTILACLCLSLSFAALASPYPGIIGPQEPNPLDLKVLGKVTSTRASKTKTLKVVIEKDVAKELYKHLDFQPDDNDCVSEDSSSSWCKKNGANMTCFEFNKIKSVSTNASMKTKAITSYSCELYVDAIGGIIRP